MVAERAGVSSSSLIYSSMGTVLCDGGSELIASGSVKSTACTGFSFRGGDWNSDVDSRFSSTLDFSVPRPLFDSSWKVLRRLLLVSLWSSISLIIRSICEFLNSRSRSIASSSYRLSNFPSLSGLLYIGLKFTLAFPYCLQHE